MSQAVDQATFNIVSHGLHAIAQEMGEVVEPRAMIMLDALEENVGVACGYGATRG